MRTQSAHSASISDEISAACTYRVDPRAPGQADREWVVPNSLGGFAMGTVGGHAQRRYHSQFTASMHPPVMRMNLVSTIDERVIIGDHEVPLTPMCFVDTPVGESMCTRFVKSPNGCRWRYELDTPSGPVVIEKNLQIADGVSAARVSYTIDARFPVRLELRPLLAMRDFHAMNTPGTISPTDLDIRAHRSGTRITRGSIAMELHAIGCASSDESAIWMNFIYTHEQDRGLDFVEDLYCPIVMTSDGDCEIRFARDGVGEIDWETNALQKQTRHSGIASHSLTSASDPRDPRVRSSIIRLAIAGDDFVVRRDQDAGQTCSILAGYPWFSDWGRDTMISLPGLLLVTGRFDEALDTLKTFADAQRDGLIPNRFDDREGDAHYNTVDASLWFVHACAEYVQSCGDLGGFLSSLLIPCIRVIESYRDGTAYNISVDPADGLVSAGNEHTQLTWMDAQRDGITFTPRHGKPIEINALWINALNQLAALIADTDPARSQNYTQLADQALRSLNATMTGGPGGLVDCLTPTNHARSISWKRNDEIRPNQSFVSSLPKIGIAEHSALHSIEVLERGLLTPVGMRTLSGCDESYCPKYVGPLIERDRAYHNGTVWPWLLGSFCEGDLRVHGFDADSRQRTIDRVCALADEMDTGTVGSIAEIYDAEPGSDGSHARKGCPAQAWSIAEPLRALVLACQHQK